MDENTDKTKKNDGGKNPSKMKKIYISIIVVMCLVIGGLTTMLIINHNQDKRTEKEPDTSVQADTDIPDTATYGNAEPSDNEKDDEKELCYVNVTKGNGWENGNKYSCQYDAVIFNKSNKDISDWKVVLTGCEDAVIDSSWNGNFNVSGDELSVTAVEYNETVTAGESINFGFILTVESEDAAKQIADTAKLYVAGDLYEYAEEKTEEAEEDTTEEKQPVQAESEAPFESHGALSVKGTDLVDQNGNKYQLKGVSTHGLAWFPEYVNKDAFRTFRDDWGANLIRLAMYTGESGGYCTDGNQDNLKKLIDSGVAYATELGMYVIIDWHILSDNNPLDNKDEAISFFQEVSAKYKDHDNVIYEICNEPNGGTTWADIKEYAEEVIPVIRANDKDAIILVGTPTWSQDVDLAAEDPITGYDNIMYTVHFYAATHKDNIRNKLTAAREKGLAVFISEFSICDASGNGSIDYDQAGKWMDLIHEYNLSYAGWNVSNKAETSSLIKSTCQKTGGWTDDDLSETGIWLKQQIKGQ